MTALGTVIAKGTHAGRPAAGTPGALYYETDTLLLFRDNGSSWDQVAVNSAGGVGTTWNAVCNGRLTLTSGTPVTTSDVTAATTVYFTPYLGNQVGTYSGTAWSVSTFTEKSLSLSGFTASTPYDIFIVDGTLALEAVAWTNTTTRATALVLQDGVLVKSGATTRRYLGTICITGTTGQCESSLAKRFVWNMYNQVPTELYITDGTATWTYSTATWRQAHASTANQIALVVGQALPSIRVTNSDRIGCSASQYGIIGIGLNRTTANDGTNALTISSAGQTSEIQTTSEYHAYLPVGYTYFAAVEFAGGATVTFYGSGQLALSATVDM